MYTYFKEFDLIREVLFAFQGLNGRIIRQDEATGRFTITPSHIAMIDPRQRMLLEKLTSFGWLVNIIKNYINSVNRDPTRGRVSQYLAAALNNELLEYYHLVTQIESMPDVTLHQIHVCSLDHYFRLKTLAMLVECCKGQRGGQLARIVYRFMQQGDKQIRAMITRILSQILLPIRLMLSQWIFHGEIIDPFGEFFICLKEHFPDGLTSSLTMMSLAPSTQAKNLNVSNHNNTVTKAIKQNEISLLSHMNPKKLTRLSMSTSVDSLSTHSSEDKHYAINDYMMPGFISRQQANKVLATGKAIHLLRKVAANSATTSLTGYDDLKKSFESTNIESLFRSNSLIECGEENEFENLLNAAYQEVNQKVLELLFGNFKLRSHFRGLRQYLFLGQGDFIRHLMDLLEAELDKPSSECKLYNLSSVLDNARRSTNAQFEDSDVIDRVDCRLLEAASENATGWDIFSLTYRINGPISTIFTGDKVRDYIEIFRQLWRTKRVEHVLTSLWSSQMHYTRYSKQLPMIRAVFHKANILLTKMQHFMQDFQNYIMFEVVECSWVELMAATDVAKDVDEIIAAHDIYLEKIRIGTMCQNDGPFECILELQQVLKALYKDIELKIYSLSEIEGVRSMNSYSSKINSLATKFKASQKIKK